MAAKRTALFFMIIVLSASIMLVHAESDLSGNAGADLFVSLWSTEVAQAEITHEGDAFRVCIEVFDHGIEWSEWEYLCNYDEKTKVLIAANTGCKNMYVYDYDTDEITKNTAYQNGSAVFSLNSDGNLMWMDETEDAGKNLLFRKMGSYGGEWQCEQYIIEFHLVDDAYRCMIWEYDGDTVTAQWRYYCTYDLATGNVVSNESGRKEKVIGFDEDEIYEEVYNDGAAVFSINSDGHLIWDDRKENVGAGFLFIKQ